METRHWSILLGIGLAFSAGCAGDSADDTHPTNRSHSSTTRAAVSAPPIEHSPTVDRSRLVADAVLRAWLNSIPAGDIAEYGFASAEEFGRASAGDAFSVSHLSASQIRSFTGETPEALVTEPVQMFAPVLVGGDTRALLELRRTATSVDVVGIGHARLAKQYGMVAADFPKARGYTLHLVRARELDADFIVVSSGAQAQLVALHTARVALGLTASDTQAPVRPTPVAVAETMKHLANTLRVTHR